MNDETVMTLKKEEARRLILISMVERMKVIEAQANFCLENISLRMNSIDTIVKQAQELAAERKLLDQIKAN